MEIFYTGNICTMLRLLTEQVFLDAVIHLKVKADAYCWCKCPLWMSPEHSDQKEINYSHLQSVTDLIIRCDFFFFVRVG